MLKLYSIAFGVAFGVSLLMTPFSILLARRFGALDPIDSRKIHTKIKPRWGGLGIMSGFFMGVFALWFFWPAFNKILEYKKSVTHHGDVLFTLRLIEQFYGILVGAFILFVMGIVDDLKPIRPGIKFLI